jgi:hypothetical protein
MTVKKESKQPAAAAQFHPAAFFSHLALDVTNIFVTLGYYEHIRLAERICRKRGQTLARCGLSLGTP